MNPIIRRDHYLQKLIDRTPAWLFLTVAALASGAAARAFFCLTCFMII